MRESDAERYDVLLRGGILYDGSGRPPVRGDLALRDGRVVAAGGHVEGSAAREIDAAGRRVTPGFLDIHTHYDAEVEALPGLDESVRHGVTTVLMGNCSLSLALGSEEELLGLYSRVENLPRPVLARWLGGRISWRDVRDYYAHLEELPLGANVATLLGHSTVRAHVMGLDRSLHEPVASATELDAMRAVVADAMEAGYVGLSIDMLPWHRMDGAPYTGISIPSQQAALGEHAALADVVRRYDRVLQATPNALVKKTVMRLIRFSAGLGRKPLRTTIVAALDVKTNRAAHRLATLLASLANRLLRANVRFQALATPFLVFSDGVTTPFFEEFSTGVRAIGASSAERRRLFRDPEFRAEFRAEWEARGERVFHRDLGDMWIVAAPDPELVGQAFAAVARQRGEEPVETFMDLIAEHDDQVRWVTVAANDRPTARRRLLGHPTTLPGFNDSGAHYRNMAFQDGALQMLREAQAHPEWMPVERAVARLTREPAEWFGIEAGALDVGAVADVVVIDPERLAAGLGEPVELHDERIGGTMRMVRRHDGVVRQVLVGGRLAYADGELAAQLGRERFGRLLRATR